MIRILKAWGPAALWAAVLFYLSSRTWRSGLPSLGIDDAVAHFLLYGGLGLALAYGRSRASRTPPHRILFFAGVLFALSDEFHQGFVPGRTPSAGDLLADVAGLAAGYWGYQKLLRPGLDRDRTLKDP